MFHGHPPITSTPDVSYYPTGCWIVLSKDSMPEYPDVILADKEVVDEMINSSKADKEEADKEETESDVSE